MQKLINKKSPFITKGDKMVQLRLDVDKYSVRVLDIVKATYGFKNRSQAVDKLAKLFNDEFGFSKMDDKYLEKLQKETDEHIKKHGLRSMTLEELDELLGLDNDDV